MRCRSLSPRRRGYVLAYFAMMAFVLMAVAALVVDLGFAVVTRRQMQTATDSASVEGLRFRDAIPTAWTTDPTTRSEMELACGTMPSPADSTNPLYVQWVDRVRRWAAQQNVVNTFDDDLNPGDGDPQNFGAGPVVPFQSSPNVPTTGQEIFASEDLTISDAPVYKPSDFQLNAKDSQSSATGNDQSGDMVSGNYVPTATTHAEHLDYSRDDFQRDGGAPPGNAFLVRMRRSNETDIGGGSSGPALPYLFGRGSLLAPELKGQGITVRATSIADARPAMAVGRQSPANQVPGVTSFGLRRTFWTRFAPTKQSALQPGADLNSQPIQLDSGGDGSLTANSQSVGSGQDGQYLDWPAGQLPTIGWRVAMLKANQPPFSDSPSRNYVPIYDVNPAGGEDRMIGFGLVRVESSNPLKITLLNGSIAATNALGALPGGVADPSISGASLSAVIAANQALKPDPAQVTDTTPIPPVLLAPSLVRSE